MSYFHDQISEALTTMNSIVGQRVTFIRGQASKVITAIEGSSTHQSNNENGMSFEFKTRDFLVDVCNLTLNGDRVEPERGDRFLVTKGVKVYEYVVNREDGGQAFDYSDQGRNRYRIYTTLYGVTNL